MKKMITLALAFAFTQAASASVLRSAYQGQLCLDINQGEGETWRHFRNAEVFPCHGESNQQFELRAAPASDRKTFTIESQGSCLDIDLGFEEAWTHESNVQIWSCNGGRNQQFQLDPKGNGWFAIRSKLNGRCLDIDLNKANGWRFERNVQLWDCNGDSNQLWRFERVVDRGEIDLPTIH